MLDRSLEQMAAEDEFRCACIRLVVERLVIVWACQWKAAKARPGSRQATFAASFRPFEHSEFPLATRFTQVSLLDAIVAERIHGFVLVDVCIQDPNVRRE